MKYAAYNLKIVTTVVATTNVTIITKSASLIIQQLPAEQIGITTRMAIVMVKTITNIHKVAIL